MITAASVVGELLDEFAAKYLMDAIGWLFRGGTKVAKEGTPVTAETMNLTLAERQEAMFAIYGAPDVNPGAGGAPGPGIEPNALRNFERLHNAIGPVLGDKLENALALALKQLKNGIWPKSVETVTTRPPRQNNNRRGGQQQQNQGNQTTVTTTTTVYIDGWEPNVVFVKAFNKGFETPQRAKKFFQVLTQEGLLSAKTKKKLAEDAKKLVRRIAMTWVTLLLVSGIGMSVALWLVFTRTNSVLLFITGAVCFVVFFGLLSIPFHVISRGK